MDNKAADSAGPQAIDPPEGAAAGSLRQRWPMLLGGAITALMIVLLGRQLLRAGLPGLYHAVPASAAFYIAFLLYYFSPVVGDYVIFRRLWHIPAAGFVALVRKRIASEMINYSGEAYFYTWARRHARMVEAPFGAVKDVSILSAQAGNALTLLSLAIAWPLGHELLSPSEQHDVLWSAAIVFAMALPFLLFSKRVYSLARRTLWWIFSIHCLRIIAGSVFAAITWHFALPTVSIAMWLLLAAIRLLVSRLPLLPTKDSVLAVIAGLLIGQRDVVSQMLAVVAALTLVMHVLLIAAMALYEAVTRVRARRSTIAPT